jgi:hypothetical protein
MSFEELKLREHKRMREGLIPGQWEYICCECFIQLNTGTGVVASLSYECAACGNTNLRFIHTLEHVEDGRQIWVGIECARILVDDSELPRLAENEVKRKECWRIFYKKPGRCTADIVDLQNRGKL